MNNTVSSLHKEWVVTSRAVPAVVVAYPASAVTAALILRREPSSITIIHHRPLAQVKIINTIWKLGVKQRVVKKTTVIVSK
ncbi:hypothetical protein K1T71_006687 [Dendrolimus kikuchii]|uniref:Uncharacterized protein n=1 Tax=Dendrolimus kikuchii TaxID=765133 RepID=A0ACC1D1I4_9NEOP|nr:hypothetical protein K1T71_006687 [Dendrolimus kikuchii]